MQPRARNSNAVTLPESAPGLFFRKQKLQHLEEKLMMRCEVCGNEYDKPIEIVVNGDSHYFDCFECAIHALAPHCEHCDCTIIGHGVEVAGTFFCCAHCAHEKGVTALQDRA
jgi:hypothetical protein